MTKLKVLAASLALAFSASASAALVDVNNTTTGSSLFLIVWKGADAANGLTYVRDLGKQLDDLVGNVNSATGAGAGPLDLASFDVDLSGDSLFTSNFSALDPSVRWTVAAARGNTQFAVSLDVKGTGNFASSTFQNQTNAINAVIGTANGQACATAASCLLSAATWGGTATFWGTRMANTLPATGTAYDVAADGIGDTASFWWFGKAASGGALQQQYANEFGEGEWQLTSEGINYIAAVPEPSTYALLAAGLAFAGFVARRRLHS